MKSIIILTALFLSFLSCNKDKLCHLEGKYKGTCVQVDSWFDISTGILHKDSSEFDETIKVVDISLDKIKVDGTAWDEYTGSNESDQDSYNYGKSASQGLSWTIEIIRSEKKLIYRKTQNAPTGPGGHFTTCTCHK